MGTNLAKIADRLNIPAPAYLTWSISCAASICIAISCLRNRLPPLDRRTLEYFIVAAIVSIALPNSIFFSAVPRVGASFVSLAVVFPPFYTYVGALLLRMERFQLKRATGIVLALGGATLLASYKLSAPDAATIWIVLTLLGPISLAIGNLYRTARWPGAIEPDRLVPGLLVASSLGLFITAFLPVVGFSLQVPLNGIAPPLLIVAQGVTFALLYWLLFILQAKGGPVYLSFLGPISSLVGIAIAVLALGETVPEGLFASTVLIAIGIVCITWGGAKGS